MTYSPSRTPPTDEPIDILYVEDNPGDARLVQEAFGASDHETALNVCPTGEDAIDFLTRRSEETALPDVVLLDLNLPDRDGCAVLETIRDDPHLQCLPVIVLTSSEAEEDVARCYDAHTNAYLTKPSHPDGFVSLVESIEDFWFEQARLPPIQL